MARRMTSPVLVGRAEVVAQLEAALQAARDGQPRHAVIGGEAGVGKTRLLAAAGELAEAQGWRVLSGGCVSMGEAGLPFAPYTEILRSLVARDGVPAVVALAGRTARDLARLVPALGPEERAADQELWAQMRLHEALLDLIQRLAGRTPLLVRLEDLHWADAGTLSATSYLLRTVHGAPITILATFRSDDVTRNHPLRPWLAEVARDANVERIDLAPLAENETAALVHHILGEELSSADIAEIQHRSDGNPFFVEELLASRVGSSAALPSSLREVLLSRIDVLPETARQLIGVAAVGGREVEHETLIAVLSESGQTPDRDVHALVEAGLLVPTRARDEDDAYSFRHALLQEAVYDSILPTERRRLHRDWGAVLDAHRGETARAADYLVNLAHHWREGRDPRALRASIAAGDAAMEGYAYAIASEEYEEALLLWDAGSDAGAGIDHVELLERAARAAYLASQFRRAVARCRAAIEELGNGDPARLTTLQALLGRTLWVSGDYTASLEAYEEGVRIAPSQPPLIRARALAGLGQVYMLHDRHREARLLCEEAIATARASGARDLEGHGLNTLAVALAGLGEIRAADDTINASLAIALELGIPDDIGRAYVNRAEIEHWSGFPDRALATSIEGIQVAADWGVASSYGSWMGQDAVTFAFECGRWDEAARLLAEADRMAGSPDGSFVYRASYVMELMACTGDPGFEALWERTRRQAGGSPHSDNQVVLLQAGLVHLAFGRRFAEALDVAREAIAHFGGMGTGFRSSELARVAAWPVADLGRAARSIGDEAAYDRASGVMAQLTRLASAWQEKLGDPGEQLSRLLRLDAAQVEAEHARMAGSDDPDAWSSLASAWALMGRPFRAAVAHWREAAAAEEAEARGRAAQALREAHHIAVGLGATPLTAQLETMARRLRVRLSAGDQHAGSATDQAYGLTRREREVLAAVAAGQTNRQIAGSLFISESTAGVHVSNIMGKLGVSSRTEAARVALDQGLVER
ncbi:MAG TPA: AAA family ATPase [Candidatus Limnocylindrales bacterium]|nr:AAA family ATPase [Candidatus Limnocylindrales bacterium]